MGVNDSKDTRGPSIAIFVKRLHLTFIEILVAVAMLATVATVVSVNIVKAINEQRFRSEVGYVVDKLRLAQNLMLLLNEDVEVHFTRAPEGFRCALSFQCSSSVGWDKELTRSSPLLTGLRDVDFKGTGKKSEENGFVVNFLSAGTVMSQGILSLYGGNRDSVRYICLRGFPHPIYATEQSEGLACLKDFIDNKQQLTQIIVPEITAKLASKASKDPLRQDQEEQLNPEEVRKPGRR